MTKREMEKKLAKYLDERYYVVKLMRPHKIEYEINQVFYDGVCAAISQIGGWERREDGKHFVKLN